MKILRKDFEQSKPNFYDLIFSEKKEIFYKNYFKQENKISYTKNNFLKEIMNAIEYSNHLKEKVPNFVFEKNSKITKAEEYFNKKQNIIKKFSHIIVPEVNKIENKKLLKKRSWSIAHNRDFFFNKKTGVTIINRYFKILQNQLYQNDYFSFKRIKGAQTKGI